NLVFGGYFSSRYVENIRELRGYSYSPRSSLDQRQAGTALLIDGRMSGLPPFLVADAGLNSGLMLLQYTAAALVSENKVLVHPASADSIPTSANQEDHVSMGSIAARHARDVLRNVERVVALELLCAAQGLDFRLAGGLRPGAGVDEAHGRIRSHVPHLDTDRDPGPDIAAATALIRSGDLLDLLPAPA
ncbi:MAG: aromatic amino acid lyase, partial [Candidatus Limnocylindrales bacterium]